MPPKAVMTMTPSAAATVTRIDTDTLAPPVWPVGGWNPWMIRKTTRLNQNKALRTTAEPMPWVARANPESPLLTPDWVARRYHSAAPGAPPPGETWLRARVDRLIRNTRN